MKRSFKFFSLFFLLGAPLFFYLTSCRSSAGRGNTDNIWKYNDVVSLQIWQPEFAALKETEEGWRNFIIKSGHPPSNKEGEGWFIRQGKITEEQKSTEDRNLYLDFRAVKENDAENSGEIKEGEIFYLKTNTHCANTQYCFVKKAHWKNIGEDKKLKFLSTEDNHELNETHTERLAFFLRKKSGSVLFGSSQIKICTTFKEAGPEETYCLASASKRDHTNVSGKDHHRIALVKEDIYENTDTGWGNIKKEFTDEERSPTKAGTPYEFNIKVEKCGASCLAENRPHKHLSEKGKLCSKTVKLTDPAGTGFCFEHINRATKSYHTAYQMVETGTKAAGVISLIATLFGQVEIAAAVGGAAALAKSTKVAKEPTRRGLRFAYDACHELCYEPKTFDENTSAAFYTEMAGLFDKKTGEEATAFTKPFGEAKDSAKWKPKIGVPVSIEVDMANQAKALSKGTAAAPFIKGALNILCTVLSKEDELDTRKANEHKGLKDACKTIMK